MMKGCEKMVEDNRKKSFVVYYDWGEALSYFNNEEVGEIFRAILSYARMVQNRSSATMRLTACFLL